MFLTRPPLSSGRSPHSVRLACIRHAASVYPEPGSNSPSRPFDAPSPPGLLPDPPNVGLLPLKAPTHDRTQTLARGPRGPSLAHFHDSPGKVLHPPSGPAQTHIEHRSRVDRHRGACPTYVTAESPAKVLAPFEAQIHKLPPAVRPCQPQIESVSMQTGSPAKPARSQCAPYNMRD